MSNDGRSVEEHEMSVIITAHARDQFRIHQPNAGYRGCRMAFIDAVPVGEDIGRAMCGRFWTTRQDQGTSYFRLARDRRGEFVCVHSPHNETGEMVAVVITYLRFGGEQEDFAWKHWPPTTNMEQWAFNQYLKYAPPATVTRYRHAEAPEAPPLDPAATWARAVAVQSQYELFAASKGVKRQFGCTQSAVRHMFSTASRVVADGDGILVGTGWATLRLTETTDGWRVTSTDKHVDIDTSVDAVVVVGT